MNNNSFEYVDLGLPSGTLWATCNVGANSPEEYGKYFAWGETDGYYDDEEHKFYWPNYKYTHETDEGSFELTKYNIKERFGIVDNKFELESSDDAAHVNMGGDWKMPNKVQMEELFNETNHAWVEDYHGSGINGRVFTSKTNGNTMFIPASGSRWNTSVGGQGDSAFLWSSTLFADDPFHGFCDYLILNYFGVNLNDRCVGYCVRGVLNKTDNIKSDE